MLGAHSLYNFIHTPYTPPLYTIREKFFTVSCEMEVPSIHRQTLVFPFIFHTHFQNSLVFFCWNLESKCFFKAQLIPSTKFQIIFKCRPWSFHCLKKLIIMETIIFTPIWKVLPAISKQASAVHLLQVLILLLRGIADT